MPPRGTVLVVHPDISRQLFCFKSLNGPNFELYWENAKHFESLQSIFESLLTPVFPIWRKQK
jgi:hypothetical protein